MQRWRLRSNKQASSAEYIDKHLDEPALIWRQAAPIEVAPVALAQVQRLRRIQRHHTRQLPGQLLDRRVVVQANDGGQLRCGELGLRLARL